MYLDSQLLTAMRPAIVAPIRRGQSPIMAVTAFRARTSRSAIITLPTYPRFAPGRIRVNPLLPRTCPWRVRRRARSSIGEGAIDFGRSGMNTPYADELRSDRHLLTVYK